MTDENNQGFQDLETGNTIPNNSNKNDQDHNVEEEDPVKIIYSGTQAPVEEPTTPVHRVEEASVHENAEEEKKEEVRAEKVRVVQHNLQNTASVEQTKPENTVETAAPTQIPEAPAPEAVPQQAAPQAAMPQAQEAARQPTQTAQQKPQTPATPTSTQGVKEVKKKKKLIIGCLGGAILLFLIFIGLVLIFASSPADSPNPIAEMLGINQRAFIENLILIVNLVFILLALAGMATTLIGFFRTSMAKKDDKITRKKGVVTSIIGASTFLVTLIIWFSIYTYLANRRDAIAETVKLPPVVTEPAETLQLSAPVTIRFDASNVDIDTKRYQIISYEWDFDNGDSLTGAIVSYTFKNKGENNGRFNVQLNLTVKDKNTGEEKELLFEKIVSIANVKVEAKIDASTTEGPIPLKVEFDASSSIDEDGDIYRYEWDFDGDGLYDDESGAKVEYTFDKIGKYEVGLRVTDNNNESGTADIIIEAKASEKPEAVISVNNTSFQAGVSYVFDAKDSKSPNGKISKYSWDFGDGSKSENTRTVSHIFEEEGTYEVELIIEDAEGETSTTTKNIKVTPYEASLSAAISTVPALTEGVTAVEGEIPLKVDFSASKGKFSPDIVEYEWDFDGDGEGDSVKQSDSYTFSEAGEYEVTLKVISADEEEFTTSIIVHAKEQGVKAVVTPSVQEGIVPLKVDFDASGSTHPSSTISSFEWDFGDGSNPKKGTSKISYKYTKIGTFVVTVTALGADGKTAQTQTTVNVLPVSLQACFEPSVIEGEAPLTVQFNSGCTTGTVVKYAWDFADGGSATTNSPIHIFEEAGEYKVTLEVSDNDNVISTASQTIKVTSTEDTAE